MCCVIVWSCVEDGRWSCVEDGGGHVLRMVMC